MENRWWNVEKLLPLLEEMPIEWAYTACNDRKAAIYLEWRSHPLSFVDFQNALKVGKFEALTCKRKSDDSTYPLPARYVCSVGAMCGVPSGGLVFVDHDGVSVDTLLMTEWGMTPAEAFPKSPTVTSGRKGRYTIVYRVPKDKWELCSTTKIKTGEVDPDNGDPEMLELRWTGVQSHVLGFHPTTGAYQWKHHPKDVAIATAPDWIVERMVKAGERKREYQQMSGEYKSKSASQWSVTIPIYHCLAKVTRAALDGDFREGRNDTGAKIIAPDLIGTANYLNQISQPFEGDPEAIFNQWCETQGLFDDDPPNQPQAMWRSAERSSPTPSLTPEMIEGCIEGFIKRESRTNYIDQAINQAKIVKAREQTQHNHDLNVGVPDEIALSEHQAVVSPADITLTKPQELEIVLERYRETEDPLIRVFMEKEIQVRFGISGNKLPNLLRLTEQTDGPIIYSLSDLAQEAFADIEARLTADVLPGTRCGFYDIDGATQGFQPTDLIILAARPSMGKTALSLDMCSQISSLYPNNPVMFFSLEMSRQQLVNRLISTSTSIPGKHLRGRLPEQYHTRLSDAMKTLMEWNIWITDKPALTTFDIKEAIADLYKETEFTPSVIFIDYLQLMEASDTLNANNRTLELGRMTRELKAIARINNVPIIALSQLSRGVESRSDKRPMMSDLRESGAIEQDADLIMMLYRDEYYNPDTVDKCIAEVIITKHRNGPVGTVKLLFEKDYPRFVNLAKQTYLL